GPFSPQDAAEIRGREDLVSVFRDDERARPAAVAVYSAYPDRPTNLEAHMGEDLLVSPGLVPIPACRTSDHYLPRQVAGFAREIMPTRPPKYRPPGRSDPETRRRSYERRPDRRQDIAFYQSPPGPSDQSSLTRAQESGIDALCPVGALIPLSCARVR